MLAKDIMTTEVLTVPPETSAEEAYNLMKTNNIRSLPVVDPDEGLVGIVTDRDVRQVIIPWRTRHERRGREFYYLARDTDVEDIMTQEVVTITPETSVAEAARLIYQHKFGGLPVVDQEGEVVGIITTIDLIGLLIRKMDAKGP